MTFQFKPAIRENVGLLIGLAGLIFIEDFTNGIDLTELMRKNM